MSASAQRFKEWPYQFVDEGQDLKAWLEMRGLSILRIEGSFSAALVKGSFPRSPGKVRDDLTAVLEDRMPGATFNVVHVERRESRGSEDMYYLSCYYAVSNHFLPRQQGAVREGFPEKPAD
jgi:hypothetical protein